MGSVTGQRAVVSSTTQPKHSLSGSMKRINLESFPCKRVEMSGVYSKDWPEVSRPYKTQSRLNPAKTSNCPRSSVISTLAQPILALAMRASVHVDLPGWTKDSIPALKDRCEVLSVQPRGTRGESGGQTGHTYDISNKHRLGHSEVSLVQTMIDGVNTLWQEDLVFQKKHGM